MFLGKPTTFQIGQLLLCLRSAHRKWAGGQPPGGLDYVSAPCLVLGKKSGALGQRFLTLVSPSVGGLLEKNLKSCWGSTGSCGQLVSLGQDLSF